MEEDLKINRTRPSGASLRILTPVKNASAFLERHFELLYRLLVNADVHREGLVFPIFLYGKRSRLIRPNNGMVKYRELRKVWRGEHYGEIQTEALGIMAHDLGYECWGMPNLEIKHWKG